MRGVSSGGFEPDGIWVGERGVRVHEVAYAPAELVGAALVATEVTVEAGGKEVVSAVVGAAVSGMHWEYQSFMTTQTAPATQVVSPDHPYPPH